MNFLFLTIVITFYVLNIECEISSLSQNYESNHQSEDSLQHLGSDTHDLNLNEQIDHAVDNIQTDLDFQNHHASSFDLNLDNDKSLHLEGSFPSNELLHEDHHNHLDDFGNQAPMDNTDALSPDILKMDETNLHLDNSYDTTHGIESEDKHSNMGDNEHIYKDEVLSNDYHKLDDDLGSNNRFEDDLKHHDSEINDNQLDYHNSGDGNHLINDHKTSEDEKNHEINDKSYSHNNSDENHNNGDENHTLDNHKPNEDEKNQDVNSEDDSKPTSRIANSIGTFVIIGTPPPPPSTSTQPPVTETESSTESSMDTSMDVTTPDTTTQTVTVPTTPSTPPVTVPTTPSTPPVTVPTTHTTSTTIQTISTTISTSSPTLSTQETRTSTVDGGLIAGAVVGGLAGVGLAGIGLLGTGIGGKMKRQNRSRNDNDSKNTKGARNLRGFVSSKKPQNPGDNISANVFGLGTTGALPRTLSTGNQPIQETDTNPQIIVTQVPFSTGMNVQSQGLTLPTPDGLNIQVKGVPVPEVQEITSTQSVTTSNIETIITLSQSMNLRTSDQKELMTSLPAYSIGYEKNGKINTQEMKVKTQIIQPEQEIPGYKVGGADDYNMELLSFFDE